MKTAASPVSALHMLNMNGIIQMEISPSKILGEMSYILFR